MAILWRIKNHRLWKACWLRSKSWGWIWGCFKHDMSEYYSLVIWVCSKLERCLKENTQVPCLPYLRRHQQTLLSQRSFWCCLVIAVKTANLTSPISRVQKKAQNNVWSSASFSCVFNMKHHWGLIGKHEPSFMKVLRLMFLMLIVMQMPDNFAFLRLIVIVFMKKSSHQLLLTLFLCLNKAL